MSTTIFSVVLLAALLHALWNFAARNARGNLSVLWLGIVLASICCLPFALASVAVDRELMQGLPFILATGVVHALYFALLGKSYETGEISSVYPVARGTGVMGTGLAASVLLAEPISLSGAGGIFCVCAGILLVGTSDRHRRGSLRAIAYALAVGGSIAVYSIIDKVGVELVNPVCYIFGMFSITAFILTPVIFVKHRRECCLALLTMQRHIWLIGIGSMGTYLIILFTYRTGMVSYIVAVREFSVVVGALLGIVILKEHFSPAKGLGIAAVTLGLILIKATP